MAKEHNPRMKNSWIWTWFTKEVKRKRCKWKNHRTRREERIEKPKTRGTVFITGHIIKDKGKN